MDNVVLLLPSGYEVTLKPRLSFGEKRQVTKVMSSKMTLDPQKKEANTEINGAAMMEAQDLTVKLMLVQVKKTDGTVLTGEQAYSEVYAMNDTDGEAVYAKVDELTAPITTEEDKKKLTSPSSNSSDQVVA